MTKVKRIGVNPSPLEKKLKKYKDYYLLLEEEKEIYQNDLQGKELSLLDKVQLKKKIFALESEMESKKIYIDSLEEHISRNK